jgi:hypothetical protein
VEEEVPFIRTADGPEGNAAYVSKVDIAHPNAQRDTR